MKGAILWKRILNEGLSSEGTPLSKIERIIGSIIKAPIIVDTRELPPDLDLQKDLKDFSGISFPFDEFWLEGTKLLTAPFGALVKKFPGDARRIILCILNIPQNPPEVIGAINFELDATGNPRNVEALVSPNMAARNNAEKMKVLLYACAYAVLDTLQMLSCKNVGLKPNENDPKSVNRAIKRHGGKPENYRYHTLVVRPPGAKTDSPGTDIGIMPRHVCRGHFSEYGPEFGKGLLFGKYSGRFYIPPHLKGKKENGIVEKDYEIRPPNPPTDPQPPEVTP